MTLPWDLLGILIRRMRIHCRVLRSGCHVLVLGFAGVMDRPDPSSRLGLATHRGHVAEVTFPGK